MPQSSDPSKSSPEERPAIVILEGPLYKGTPVDSDAILVTPYLRKPVYRDAIFREAGTLLDSDAILVTP